MEDKVLAELMSGLTEQSPLRARYERRATELNLKQSQVCQYLEIESRSLQGLLDGTAKRVDYALAIKMRNFLGLSAEEMEKFFIVQNEEVKQEDTLSRQVAFVTSHFDLTTLHNIKFLDKNSPFKNIVARLEDFFGLASIEDYALAKKSVFFSKSKRTPRDQMREFWVRSATHHVELLENPYPYNRKELLELVPRIRVCTTNVEKGLLTVLQALYRVGVTVVYQPQVPNVQVRGATFAVNGKPAIALTDFRKSYATLWFALIHELHHVLYDWDALQAGPAHLTGDPDLFLLNEDKADRFAREFLFSQERSNYIRPFLGNPFMVQRYADQCQVHPSIIYSFEKHSLAQAGDKNAWAKFRDIKEPDITHALKAFNSFAWDKKSVENARIYREEVFSLV